MISRSYHGIIDMQLQVIAMSSIDKAFYSRFAPVLNEPGWFETGALGYGSVFFRNIIHKEPDIKITVGIVVCPSSWHYCANYSLLASGSGINVKPIRAEAPWTEVRDYYLKHGLSAYATYKKDLSASIEAASLSLR